MPRVKRGSVRRANRKKLSKLTKGFFLTKSKLYRSMREAADRAGRFAYRDRRRRKRDFRRLWIVRISAAARLHDTTYSQLMHGLKTLGIELDRKMLSEMAATDAQAFAQLVEKVKAAGVGAEAKVGSDTASD
jgi:large subunit ribosomal protein L20